MTLGSLAHDRPCAVIMAEVLKLAYEVVMKLRGSSQD
jgi:hypothetical protein